MTIHESDMLLEVSNLIAKSVLQSLRGFIKRRSEEHWS